MISVVRGFLVLLFFGFLLGLGLQKNTLQSFTFSISQPLRANKDVVHQVLQKHFPKVKNEAQKIFVHYKEYDANGFEIESEWAFDLESKKLDLTVRYSPDYLSIFRATHEEVMLSNWKIAQKKEFDNFIDEVSMQNRSAENQ